MSRLVNCLLTVVQELSPRQQREFVKALFDSRLLTEDDQDLLVIELRRKGPSRLLNDVISDMKRKGRFD